MDDSSFNSITHTVEKKVEGKYRLQRIMYVLGAVLASILLCGACVAVKMLIYFTPVMFMLCLILFKYMFMYFQIEYRYTIERGVFTMEKVFGAKKCKKYYQVTINEVDSIVPHTDVTVNKGDVVFPSCISLAEPTPDLYAMIVNDGDKKTVLYFEATKKTLKIMKYHNKNTVVVDTLRH